MIAVAIARFAQAARENENRIPSARIPNSAIPTIGRSLSSRGRTCWSSRITAIGTRNGP